jgi:uncharacterized membrane protein
MNDQDRLELDRVKNQQARLELELAQLAAHLKTLERRFAEQPLTALKASPEKGAMHVQLQKATAPALSGQPTPAPTAIPAPPVISAQAVPPPREPAPDWSRVSAMSSKGSAGLGTVLVKGKCRNCGQDLEFPLRSAGEEITCPHCLQSTILSTALPAIPTPPPVRPPTAAAAPAPAGAPAAAAARVNGQSSFELRFGTHWAPRIGIVLVLTALVFFGNYAYQNFIGRLGAAGKLSLMYFGSLLLLGGGAWWQRKEVKESLKNYAQVLFAGGLAAVYFTTYAAHHFARLRVIESALLDGVLLLAWAGFIVWIADRKKSELLAFFAVGLAYYTSIVTRVGSFTLYSNLVLTLAAVFFLVRNRWAGLSFGSLVATYAAYVFWRFFDGSEWHWASPEAGLWSGTYFLISYWIVFTAAVFLSKAAGWKGENRTVFLTFNNGAFFTLFLLTMLQVRHGQFWVFAVSYGGALLAMAEAARRILPAEPLTKNAYVTQGLVLVTLGLITKFSGLERSLILAAESVTLLSVSYQRRNIVLQTGCFIAAGLAVAWGIDGLRGSEPAGLYKGIGLAVFMLANTLLSHRRAGDYKRAALRPEIGYFAVLLVVSVLAVTWNYASHESFPLIAGLEAVLLVASVYVLGVAELAMLGQICLLAAQVAWAANVLDDHRPSAGQSAVLIGFSVGLAHWWQRQRKLESVREVQLFWQGLYAVASVALLFLFAQPRMGAPAWLAVSALLAMGLTAYAAATRLWLLAAAGQLLLAASIFSFTWQLLDKHPASHLAFVPIAGLLALSFGNQQWLRSHPGEAGDLEMQLLQIGAGYRWIALFMSVWWVHVYVPDQQQIWAYATIGLALFALAAWRRNAEAVLFSVVFSGVGLAMFWLPLPHREFLYAPNLLGPLLLLGQQQLARRLPDRFRIPKEAQRVFIAVGGLSLWWYLIQWVSDRASGGFFLTASWSALALVFFTAGMALRERVYRWLGLFVLGCALCRIVIIDVWRLESLYRILSFLALGVVLLVLGYIYSRFQEKIREWL